MNVPYKILIVDDKEVRRKLLLEGMHCLGYVHETAANESEALKKLDNTIDLVLLDLSLPTLHGFEIASRIRTQSEYPDVPILIMSSQRTRAIRLQSLEAGANDFITRPIDVTELKIRATALLKMKRAQDALKQCKADLQETIILRTTELSQVIEYMAGAQSATLTAYLDTIRRLALAAESRDRNTAAHIHRVSQYCGLIGSMLCLRSSEIETILTASIMHDIGKIGIPDAILLKSGKLTVEEWAVMKQHTIIGARILQGSDSPLLQTGEQIALAHHEKWDGTGYPHGLSGEAIPVCARICAVADVFDALTTHRAYKPAYSNDKAIRIMSDGRGTHFDPKLLDVFLRHQSEVEAIQERYADEKCEMVDMERF